jgi:adenylyltransferase/sulfurtransferase
VQELLKLLHHDRDLPTLTGKCYVFNGLTHDSYVVEYQRKPDCMSHDTYDEIEERPWSVRTITLGELVVAVKKDLGEQAVVDFDREIATVAACTCGTTKNIYLPVHKLRGQDIACPKCSKAMNFDSIHTLNGTEVFLDKTPLDIGIPLLHILAGRNGTTIKYYEFSGDADEVFTGF